MGNGPGVTRPNRFEGGWLSNGPMTGHETAPVSNDTVRASSSWILLLIGAAVLTGAGLLGTAYWLISDFSWMFFASLIAVVVGAYLLFTRASGPEHA